LMTVVDSWDVNAVPTGKWFPTLAVNLPVFTFREV
jgi:hypothetical protein